ncbi:LLM class flavin-dependent oxidoreductase [Cellulomonas carbonis]|uniref:Luciferase n=1 Tax=Cellulomonas carbonis T26 TaxID=947969 RepID=A0A0A0BRD1_9CELL|nr:LLM class flavin-dependent oxidoreductase [Cellulomonas carbonis]KGM10177.1 luciferase [Cellulomonas carbonis T26]GGC12590.1 luciferase-like protein [Cellulomonas carbonis]
MRIGVVGTYGSATEVVGLARDAEEAGWDGFFTWDGISLGGMDTWDPWTLLGAVATVTSRITLGALVFVPGRRRPWKLAREVLTVDHLSGGRLVLPAGLGVLDDGGLSRVSGEATALRERAERLDEALAILDLAASGRPFSFEGRHHRVTDLVIAPPPVQRPRVPVWPVAGLGSARSMGRAARWDGAVLQHVGEERDPTPAEVADAVAWLRERRERLAAAPDTGVRPDTPFDVVVQGRLPGDASAAQDRLAALAEAGATWWVEARWDPARDTPAALRALVEQGPPR